MKPLPQIKRTHSQVPVKLGEKGIAYFLPDDADRQIPAWRALRQTFLKKAYKPNWESLQKVFQESGKSLGIHGPVFPPEMEMEANQTLVFADLATCAAQPAILTDKSKKLPLRVLHYLATEPVFSSLMLHTAIKAAQNPTKSDLAMIAIRKNPEKTNKEISFETGIEISLVTKTRKELSRQDAKG